MNKQVLENNMKKKGDSKKRMLLVSAAVITLALLMHVLRITRGWDLQIASWSVPLWLSAIAVVLGLVLLFLILKAYKK